MEKKIISAYAFSCGAGTLFTYGTHPMNEAMDDEEYAVMEQLRDRPDGVMIVGNSPEFAETGDFGEGSSNVGAAE